MKDYACCGIKLDSLHELLEHYEEEHAAVPNQTMGRTPTGQQAYAKIDTHHNHSHILPNPAQLQQQHQPPRTSNVILPPINHAFPSHPAVPGDLDDLDSMDMDDGPAPAVQPVNTDRQFQPQPQFGRQSSQSAMSSPINAFQNPRTTPPIDSQYNPTVSSVNAPNMDPMSRPGDLELNGMSTPRMPQTEGEFDMASLEGTPNQVSQATIDDPAKRLFAKQGFGGMRSPGFISQMGTPSVNGSQMGQPDETKPFRCPVIGCEKAYKNQNGLKYHKQVSIAMTITRVIWAKTNFLFAARSHIAEAQGEPRRHIFYCRPDNFNPVSRHDWDGEGKAIPVRDVLQAVQEPQWTQVPPFAHDHVQPGLADWHRCRCSQRARRDRSPNGSGTRRQCRGRGAGPRDSARLLGVSLCPVGGRRRSARRGSILRRLGRLTRLYVSCIFLDMFCAVSVYTARTGPRRTHWMKSRIAW